MKNKSEHQLLYPFYLRGMLRGRLRIVNWIPLIDLCLVACLFAFLRTDFIFSPGMTLDLPQNMTYSQQGVATSEVITISGSNSDFMLIFDHQLFQGISEWQNYLMNKYAKKDQEIGTLMIKANNDANIELIMAISSIAEKAGFKKILIASDS